MYNKKKLPKSQYELTKGVPNKDFGRDNDVRRDDDKLKELSIGLYDVDNTIKWYFDHIIRPEIDDFGSKTPVPVVFGSPEKWKNIQSDGYFRDKNGKIQSPLIAYKRTGINKNRSLGNKVDGNFPQAYYTEELKYNQFNKYDQFAKLTNRKPVKTYINTIVPDYVDITYDVIVWTDFIEHMNKIVESIIYSEGSFWGEPDRFKFRTKIDSYTNTTDLLQDSDRVIRTAFTITMFGYLVPDALVKNLSQKTSGKTFDTSQLVMTLNADPDPTIFKEKDELEVGAGVELQAPIITSAINPNSLLDATLVAYLNTNKTIQATTVTAPSTALFNGSFLAAPGSLPATSVNNFAFFINGQYVEPGAITSFVDNGNGTCTLTVNVGQLGFTLAATDEIVAIGKFA